MRKEYQKEYKMEYFLKKKIVAFPLGNISFKSYQRIIEQYSNNLRK